MAPTRPARLTLQWSHRRVHIHNSEIEVMEALGTSEIVCHMLFWCVGKVRDGGDQIADQAM